MVGYDPHSDTKLKPSHYAIAGGLSGFFTRATLQPLDVLKIRFQLQVEPIKRSNRAISKYTGVLQATKSIVVEEGVFALWKGQVPAQFLSIIYGFVQFSSYEYFTKLFWLNVNGERYKNSINFICGSLAGVAATVAAQPFDVIRTRLIAQSEPKTYVSVIHAFRSIVYSESVFALYRGLLPALYQIVPYAGTVFWMNGACNAAWLAVGLPGSKTQPYAFQSLICGGIAGIAGKLVVYPLDLIKKRSQLQGFTYARRSFGKNVIYKGTFDCFLKVIREESFLGLYKGLSPSLLKAFASTALHFAFYEQILNFLKRRNGRAE
ncbi:mitochondrial thiamine pyrophosphate carrier-like protein [Dinothrombium tinctorium]|uniref:Mitochondrial thiamine pyrophosphate carrier n=1 Tax=Dinothrombium tinctorium TaxID=1965070 RepID=A0A3S3P271_9ACAR|nr:mitochondrial thiamine pyrophosphate carrier-like protein [Dinothrombium tinctorium]